MLKANQIINYFEANPKANPMVVLMANLYGYFSKILQIHYLPDKTGPGIAREMGINPYFVKDFEIAARNYNSGKIIEVISLLREYDLKSKGVDSTSSPGELMREMLFKILH